MMRTSENKAGSPVSALAFAAIALIALLAAIVLTVAAPAGAEQSCSGRCLSSAAELGLRAGPARNGRTDDTTTGRPAYSRVAAVGLGALALVLLAGGSMLVLTGRRRTVHVRPS